MFLMSGGLRGREHCFGRFPDLETAKQDGERVGPLHSEFPGLWGYPRSGNWAQVSWEGLDPTAATVAEKLSQLVVMAAFRNTLLDLVSVFGSQLVHLSPAARRRVAKDVFGSKPPSPDSIAAFREAWDAVSYSPHRCGVCAAEKKAGAYAVCPQCGTSDFAAASLGM
ncbi:hypothetical protein HY442_01050 [Candidatus Parcubacteria bacterium]|nr:hypothetical protein [Candidatus Parcubacteria bacterium]MBI4385581.1 hypothetical protein [Candidatus Parcubacteria bacterium]